MAVSQLGYLGVGVKDMDAWTAFATGILGMELSEQAPDGTLYLRMDELHHRIAVHPNGPDDMLYVGWQTPNRKEFEATKASLLQSGVEYTQGTAEELANRHVVDMVTFDLCGVRNEVYYGPHVLFERPFNPPIGMSGFRTGELGLGHVGLYIDGHDLERAKAILMEGLGFKVSDAFYDGDEAFFHCNPRQHTCVLMPREGPDAPRLEHFMVELNSIDDVGRCLDRCEDNGVPLQIRLGRHTNDHMISFYMWSPSRFSVEYGWGGRLIDDDTWQVSKYDFTHDVWGHRYTPYTNISLTKPESKA